MEYIFVTILFLILILFLFVYKYKRIDPKIVVELLVVSLGVVGFFAAILYYSGNPKVVVESCGYYPYWYLNQLKKLNEENKSVIPNSLLEEIENQVKQENQPVFKPINIYLPTVTDSYEGDFISGANAENLFEDFYTPFEHKMGPTIVQINVDLVRKLIQKAESILPPKDYDQFIKLLYKCKEIYEVFEIQNQGNVDLQKVSTVFYSPISRLAGHRENNILDISTDFAPFEFKRDAYKSEIIIPDLKINQKFQVAIKTKENRIARNEITTFYTPITVMNRKLAFIHVVLTFITFCILGILFQKQTDT